MFRSVICGIVLVALFVDTGEAQVAVMTLEGPRASQARRLLADRLRDLGHLVVDLESSRGSDVERVAARTAATHLVVGRVRRRGGQWRGNVTLYDGGGRQITRTSTRGRTLGALAARLARRLEISDSEEETPITGDPIPTPTTDTSISVVEPEVVPEDDGVAEMVWTEESTETETPTPERFGAMYRALELQVRAKLFSRELRYSDDLYGLLREYRLGLGPAFGMAASWFPAAHFTNGIAAHIGIGVSWERSVGLGSTDAAGTEFPTRAQEWLVDVRSRIPVGDHELRTNIGLGGHSFQIDNAGPAGPNRLNIPVVPAVSYRFVEIGIGASVRLMRSLTANLAMGYRAVRDAGGIESDVWLPLATTRGYTGALGLEYAFPSGVVIGANVDFRRYVIESNVRADDEDGRADPNIVGGAIDHYMGYSLTLAYRR